jgi:hypothetical protein
MGRQNRVLKAILQQDNIETWLDSRENPAPALRQLAAAIRGMGDGAGAAAAAAELGTHAALWDKAYTLKAAAERVWTDRVGMELAHATLALVQACERSPHMHPARIPDAYAAIRHINQDRLVDDRLVGDTDVDAV